MINQSILRQRLKGFTFLQQAHEHPYHILQKGRIRGMMNSLLDQELIEKISVLVQRPNGELLQEFVDFLYEPRPELTPSLWPRKNWP